MKIITLEVNEKIVVKTTEYKKIRDKVIDDIMNNTKTIYKKDKEMINGIQGLCDDLTKAAFNKVSLELVYGLSGFIYYASMVGNKKITKSNALTTCIHDLGEFRRHKNEAWFSPKTHRYIKFAS